MTFGTGSSQTLATWAYGMAFGKGSSAVIKLLGGVGRRHPAAADRPRDGLRLHLRPAPAGGGPDQTALAGRGGRLRSGWRLTAVMLFPLYWMINVSLTQRRAIRDADLFPRAFTFDHYRVALQDQLPYLGTSIAGRARHRRRHALVIAAPAAYALAHLFVPGRRGAQLPADRRPDDPGGRHVLGLLPDLQRPRHARHDSGLILADSTLAVPFAVLLFEAFMIGIPRELLQAAQIDGASYWRTFRSIVLPISRNAAVTVALFAFLWSWSDFLFASTLNRGGGDSAPDHDGHLRLHRRPKPGVGPDDGHRCAGVHPDRTAHRRSPSATSPPASPPAPSRTDPLTIHEPQRRHRRTDATAAEQLLVRRPPDPVLDRGVVAEPLTGRRACTPSPTQIHLVSHVNGMHPVFQLRPERDGEPGADPVARRCRRLWSGGPKDGCVDQRVFDGAAAAAAPRPRPPAAARPRPPAC